VQTVYPQVTEQAITEANPVPVPTGVGNANYMLGFIGDFLSDMSLQNADQPCF
jgi:hypothetical protein